VWQELGVDHGRLRDAMTTAGAPAVPNRNASVRYRSAVLARRVPAPRPAAFSAAARRVLGDAFVLARAQRARRLRPGHLLLAIAAQRDDEPARGLLSMLGVEPTDLVHAVCVRLAGADGRTTVSPAAPLPGPRQARPAPGR
jgi:hypothetical protein